MSLRISFHSYFTACATLVRNEKARGSNPLTSTGAVDRGGPDSSSRAVSADNFQPCPHSGLRSVVVALVSQEPIAALEIGALARGRTAGLAAWG
jgi:hypothetical protein